MDGLRVLRRENPEQTAYLERYVGEKHPFKYRAVRLSQTQMVWRSMKDRWREYARVWHE